MRAPIYEQLAEETGVHVPEYGEDPIATLLPSSVSTGLLSEADRYPLEDMHQHGDAA